MSHDHGERNGDGEADDALEPVLGEIPGEILELAESCRRFALGAVGVELDYDAETLPILDEYVRGAVETLRDRPEAEPLIARAVAAYFGEVVRRRLDGFWRKRPTPHDDWELCARRALMAMIPMGMVMESMARSADHPGPSAELRLAPEDEELAAERLARLPEVSEDEYYLLSTRLEVIETVYEALRDRMKTEERDSLVFEESDYEE